MRTCITALLLIVLVYRPTLAEGKPDVARKKQLSALKLKDVTGKLHAPFDNKKTKAVALIFVSTDCPIANAFQPALGEFAKAYGPKGIECFMVYSTTGTKSERIKQHVKDYRITAPAIHDASQSIGKLVEAKVTPEAILIDRTGSIRYRGLINNLYAGYGKKRTAATQHYFRDAADSVIAGRTVAKPATKPLGCFIHYGTPKKAPKKQESK